MDYFSKSKETPLMRQYNKMKADHPGSILLFRVGDFYETFGEDAITTSKILNIILTKRANGGAAKVDLAGFPYHALDTYIPKLLKAGQRVAIGNQLEDPKFAKGIVKRGVTEIITPGLTYHDSVLDKKSNNFLASIHIKKDIIGISFVDITSGEFLTSQGNIDYIKKMLQSFDPKEVIFSKKDKKTILSTFNLEMPTYTLESWVFELDYAYEKLTSFFQTRSLKGFGIEGLNMAIISAGAIIRYLEDNNIISSGVFNTDSRFIAEDTSNVKNKNGVHINSISRINPEKYMWLDQFTIKNLELIYPQQQQGIPLIDVIDNTLTALGGRLLKKWLLLPLRNSEEINQRLNLVQTFIDNQDINQIISTALMHIGDLERLAAKIGSQRINPREVLSLQNSLQQIKKIKQTMLDNSELAGLGSNIGMLKESPDLEDNSSDIDALGDIIKKINDTINEDAPVNISVGNIIKKGVNEELDSLKTIIDDSEDFLENFRKKAIQDTGISSLKISYNKIFGYYIEVTNAHKNKVPESWFRKQTLVNAERYITEDLKYHEEKILNAKEKISNVEQQIFRNLIEDLSQHIKDLQKNAKIIAKIDCVISFTKLAVQNNYTRPSFNVSGVIDIKQGRHPVIEQTLGIDQRYVVNDIYLDKKEQQIIIITGPNMAGKSAMLRQVALITIMAQIGSYVPAENANLCITDKIFTRVGASDNLAKGESTFMVEMNETASILNNLTENSLVIMDEIGRGTSTYDGISIAQAVVEFLHNHKCIPKTLFATHYHELNDIEGVLPRVKNYNVEVKVRDKKIIFMHKLVKGGSKHSYGINVARMAGIPRHVVDRATFIMNNFCIKDLVEPIEDHKKVMPNYNIDKSLEYQFLDDIMKNLEIDSITPIQALMKLQEIKKCYESLVC